MKKMSKNRLLLHGISGVVSFILVYGILKFFKVSFPFSEMMFILALFGMAFFIETAIPLINKREAVVWGIFSAVLSASLIIGNKIHYSGVPYYYPYTISDFCYLIVIGVVLFFILIDLSHFIGKYTIELSQKKIGLKFWLVAFGIIAACWLPYFIIYFPGNLSGDSYSSINQSIGITPLYNQQPVLFTLFVKVCISTGLIFGSLNFAVGCFSFAQLLCMTAILSYSVYWLAKKNLPKFIVILVLAYYVLNPVIAMYSITMWKDVFFGGWMMLLTLLIFDSIQSGGKTLLQPKGLILFSVCCLLVAFSRNNGIYVIFITLLALGIYFRKHFKVLAPVFVSIVLLTEVIQGPLYSALHIAKGGFAESVGIPLQQIGYTLKSDGKITKEQEDFINQLMPVDKFKLVYNAEYSDAIKFDPEFNNGFLEIHKMQFLKVWAEMLLPNFKSYVKAYLMQTIGYWHIGTTNWICQYGAGENDKGLQYNQHLWLQNRIQKVITNIYTIPIFRDIFSIAFMVWTAFFYCIAMMLKKRSKYIHMAMPLLAVWATMMLAVPTFCEFRYMYSFHLLLPFLVIMFFMIPKKENSPKEHAESVYIENKVLA